VTTPSRFERCRTAFIISVTIILFVTSFAKIASLFGKRKFLYATDRLFGIREWQLLLSVGLVELAVAGILLFGKSPRLKLILVTWLSVNFVCYRVATWLFGLPPPCACLGSMAELFSISQSALNVLFPLVVAYLFLGSTMLLIVTGWKRRIKDRLLSANASNNSR